MNDEEGSPVIRSPLPFEERALTAERRIANALAYHHRSLDSDLDIVWCGCGHKWDTVADRCTSPTVDALTAETETQ